MFPQESDVVVATTPRGLQDTWSATLPSELQGELSLLLREVEIRMVVSPAPWVIIAAVDVDEISGSPQGLGKALMEILQPHIPGPGVAGVNAVAHVVLPDDLPQPSEALQGSTGGSVAPCGVLDE